MTPPSPPSRPPLPSSGSSPFGDDFRRFFARGLVAVLPTLITFWLIVWAWGFLWENAGKYILSGLSRLIWLAGVSGVPYTSTFYLQVYLEDRLPRFIVQAIGVGLSVVAIYLVGLVTGGFIGKTAYRLAENVLMRVPLIRAVYPAVKQITDFLLKNDRSTQFSGSRVVAVRNHNSDIWSIGIYTGSRIEAVEKSTGREMVTVFVPSTPTAFTGYVVVAPREDVVELPLTVEEAMRVVVSGGVVSVGQVSASPQAGSVLPDNSTPVTRPSAQQVHP